MIDRKGQLDFDFCAIQAIVLNLLCSFERIQLTNYIVGALDKTILISLASRGYPVFPAYESSKLREGELASTVEREE